MSERVKRTLALAAVLASGAFLLAWVCELFGAPAPPPRLDRRLTGGWGSDHFGLAYVLAFRKGGVVECSLPGLPPYIKGRWSQAGRSGLKVRWELRLTEEGPWEPYDVSDVWSYAFGPGRRTLSLTDGDGITDTYRRAGK